MPNPATRSTLVAITLFSFAGCTTLQVIEEFSPSRIQQEVEVGDRVRIVALTGVAYDLKVTKVEVDALQGKTRAGKRYRIQYEAIKSIHVEKISGWKTATGVGATLSAVIAVLAAVTIYAFIQFFEALED